MNWLNENLYSDFPKNSVLGVYFGKFSSKIGHKNSGEKVKNKFYCLVCQSWKGVMQKLRTQIHANLDPSPKRT